MFYTGLAFSKLLCLAQGRNSNYLANILITSHISHTAEGNKMNIGAYIQLSLLYKLVSGANSVQHIEFATVLTCFKTCLLPRLFFWWYTDHCRSPYLICSFIKVKSKPLIFSFTVFFQSDSLSVHSKIAGGFSI